MKKETIGKYTTAALAHLQEPDNAALKKGAKGPAVEHTLKGKAASFGPSVISIGVLPTVAFYAEDSDSKKEHHVILAAIWAILKTDDKLQTAGCRNLQEYVMNAPDPAALKRDRILLASTAYKLALRTYPDAKEGKQ